MAPLPFLPFVTEYLSVKKMSCQLNALPGVLGNVGTGAQM